MTDVYTEAELYCAAFDWPVDDEIDWLLREVERLTGRRPSSVLEPMCGNARYGPAFADRGTRYVGLDRSQSMLARAPQRDGVVVEGADARSFSIAGGPFDLAWCPINSIRHLDTHDDLVAHLRCVRAHLAVDGAYIVQSDLVHWDGPWPTAPEEQSAWAQPQDDGSEVRAQWWVERCDLARRRTLEHGRFERIVEGEVVESVEGRYEMLMICADEWREAAAAGGFEITQVCAHGSGEQRKTVTLSRELENDEVNYYLFLRPAGK